MKKNVIALAVAAAMAAPAAMAEVKVSGQLQAELISLSGDRVTEGLYVGDAQENGVEGSGNFGAINFSAAEDLGGGMKAITKYGMNVDVDGRGITQRDAYVGLSGGFGTILAGTLSSPYKSSTVKWDPFLATSAQARGNNGMSNWHNSYLANAIAYANKFGMAKVVAAVVIDDAADDAATASGNDTSGDHAFSFSVNMPVGPVELAVAYLDASDLGTRTTYNTNILTAQASASTGAVTTPVAASTETGDNSAVKVGVRYTAGAMGVAFQYETLEVGNNDQDWMYINGTYTAGANTFAAAYGQSEWDGSNATPTYMSLGMVHSFSKSTSAHVAYVAMDTDTAAGDDSGIAAGLRVKF